MALKSFLLLNCTLFSSQMFQTSSDTMKREVLFLFVVIHCYSNSGSIDWESDYLSEKG